MRTLPKMLPRRPSLLSLTLESSVPGRFIADDLGSVAVSDLHGASCFAGQAIDHLRGCSVLLATTRQLPSVLAAIQLDGVASRILLCTPDLAPHLPAIVAQAQVDVVVSDQSNINLASLRRPVITCHGNVIAYDHRKIGRDIETEWVLFTSGTTGRPKMVAHTLASLSGPLDDGVSVAGGVVWSTFYDIRRYGGLQMLLRALIGGGSMVLSSGQEPVSDFLTRLAAAGVARISGTPSHWRRALMSPDAGAISPAYVRLSGEAADQAILDRLHSRYPAANIAHAFASTEAGVGFDVRDGLAGFPMSLLDNTGTTGVEMRIEGDTLRIRSGRTATRYLGQQLPESDGFIDTGDLVERRGDRYYFMGRREGVINVGGQKVYPEEVEDVITRHPDVQIARVWPRKSPITGAVVAADVVLRSDSGTGSGDVWPTIRADLMKACHQALPAHKVPATWRQVGSIGMTASGKIQRA
jgi:acyl-coenzyme A synthetase/AMP-(fatty) acid ligase